MNGRARKTLIFFYEGGRKRAATNKKELGKFIRQAFSYTTPNQNHTHAMTKATIRAAAALAVLTALWAKTWPTIDDAFGCIMMTAVRAPFSPSTMCALLMGKEAQTDQD